MGSCHNSYMEDNTLEADMHNLRHQNRLDNIFVFASAYMCVEKVDNMDRVIDMHMGLLEADDMVDRDRDKAFAYYKKVVHMDVDS